MNVPNSERSDVEAVLWRHKKSKQLRKNKLFKHVAPSLLRLWNVRAKMLSLKRKPKACSLSKEKLKNTFVGSYNFCQRKKKRNVVRTRQQMGCHGNEVRFLPHTVFSVNQIEDAPQHLFMWVSRWKITVAFSAIVTSLLDGRDFLPSAGLRDLSEEKWLSCLIFALWWLMRIYRS